MSGEPYFRAPRREIADKEGWEILRRAKGGPCRLCNTGFGVSLHHLVPRSLGGDDLPWNLVSLCGSGTTGCHGLVEARDPVTLAKLRAALEEPEIAYIAGKKGLAFLHRYYPAGFACTDPELAWIEQVREESV